MRRQIKFLNKFQAFFHRYIKPAWGNIEWLVITVLAIGTVTLGYCGFCDYFTSLGQIRSKLDCLYLSLQLFTLESGSIAGAKPWELDMARFLVPALAAYTAIQALMIIFARQSDEKVKTLKNANPQILKQCTMSAFQFDIRWLESYKNYKIFTSRQMHDVTMVYICFDDNSLSLRTALILSNPLKSRTVPIIVRMTTETGLTALINDKRTFSGIQKIYAFGLLDQTCTPECIVGLNEM